MIKEYEAQVVQFEGPDLSNLLREAAKWIDEALGAVILDFSMFEDEDGFTVLVYWM